MKFFVESQLRKDGLAAYLHPYVAEGMGPLIHLGLIPRFIQGRPRNVIHRIGILSTKLFARLLALKIRLHAKSDERVDIYLFQCVELHPIFIYFVRRNFPSARIVMLVSDNPMLVASQAGSRLRHFLNHLDLVVIFLRRQETFVQQISRVRVMTSCFGFSQRVFQPRLPLTISKRVSYVGTYSPLISGHLHYLCSIFDVSVYGEGWRGTKFYASSTESTGTTIRNHIAPGEIVVNWFKPEHFSGISMKPFELMALGVVLLCQRTNDLTEILGENSPSIIYFDGLDDLVSILESLIDDHRRRRSISRNAIETSKKFEYGNNLAKEIWL